METLIFAFRFLAVSQAIFFLFSIVLSKNPMRVRTIAVALSIGVLAYLLAPVALDELGRSAAAALWNLAALVPMMMVLLAWVVFEEHKIVPPWLLLLVFADVAVEIWTHVVFAQTGDHQGVLMEAMPYKRILLVAGALYLIWRGRECDLVEMRMKLRWWIIGSTAGLVVLIDFSNIISSYAVPQNIALFSLAAVFALCLLVNLVFLKINPGYCLVGEPLPIENESQDPQILQLLSRMEQERLYADHDLRVGSLADMLGLPEYQLRKKINQNLGYRNFNQFVNRYRIEEAGQRLHTEPRIPVLSVALDVGFRSISSFNTAFQNHFGVSPTVYRKQRFSR